MAVTLGGSSEKVTFSFDGAIFSKFLHELRVSLMLRVLEVYERRLKKVFSSLCVV